MTHRIARPLYAAATAAALLLPLALQGQSARETAKSFPKEYQILQQRSIFSRERVRTGFSERSPAEVRASTPVFSGVVKDEEEFIAFLEDPRTGKATLVRVGQKLPQGTVEQITLDYLLLRTPENPEPQRIDVGRTLTGDLRPAPAAVTAAVPPTSAEAPTDTQNATTTPATASTAPASVFPPSGGGTVADLAERMRQRRRQEMQGK